VVQKFSGLAACVNHESGGRTCQQIVRDEASPTEIPRPAFRLPEGNSILDSREQNRTTSLDNLPRINQRREVKADNIYLQLGAIGVLDHGTTASSISRDEDSRGLCRRP